MNFSFCILPLILGFILSYQVCAIEECTSRLRLLCETLFNFSIMFKIFLGIFPRLFLGIVEKSIFENLHCVFKSQ